VTSLSASAGPRVRVWRGIAVTNEMPHDIEEYARRIREQGCPLGESGGRKRGGFQLLVPLVDHHTDAPQLVVDRLLSDPLPPRYDADDVARLSLCVCGDVRGASFYASRDGGSGLVVEAEVEQGRLCIDGRDFLYNVVARFCERDQDLSPELVRAFCGAFGSDIAAYLSEGRRLGVRTKAEGRLDRLFRLVDHIAMDVGVIAAHARSQVTIRGRYETQFRSAFGVIGGLRREDVVGVHRVGDLASEPEGEVLTLAMTH
jgi:hypothetical protein